MRTLIQFHVTCRLTDCIVSNFRLGEEEGARSVKCATTSGLVKVFYQGDGKTAPEVLAVPHDVLKNSLQHKHRTPIQFLRHRKILFFSIDSIVFSQCDIEEHLSLRGQKSRRPSQGASSEIVSNR